MQYKILLDRNEKTRDVEVQEQSRFIKSLIEALDIPIEDWDTEEPLSFEGKLNLKKTFQKYNINIINDGDSNIKVFVNSDLVGEWFKPKYKLKEDFSKINPKERLYYEMEVNCWSMFDEETNNGSKA